ncbi:hypothetical protein DENIS_1266 [Desulfonema ishimotonii]|uniref:Uncharacterized protein n=1 Tax=Desulfonema ishimotonii TaxID=45657 RepID=A0A401FTN4_9BACT|nr:hypothetical protein [Desulfonema ishimotonii]GBC60315.1 hypothetical protein DENIS_1266 [Desulfonema ishimotonii]
MAKKKNDYPEEIDLTSFAWVNAGSIPQKHKPGCGGCHPGGGGLEFDRDGNRYDKYLAANPEIRNTLDGDYYKSLWDKTGVIEADCFLCHLPGYNFSERNHQLNALNFRWAALAGSGIGQVIGSVNNDETPRVIYNKRLFNADGKLVIDISYPPKSDNCVNCHGLADLIKRGFSWNDRINHDVHNLQGLECTHCHPGNPEHNFAKGDENLSTVRDDLDNTMLRCRDCHYNGVMAAPIPKHDKVRPNHLEKFACEVCHIPAVHRAAAQGLDVSTGEVLNYPTPGGKKIGSRITWRPAFHRGEDGKLWPVNQFEANLYTNLDEDGIYYPLFAHEMGQAYPRIKDRLSDQEGHPLIDTENDILLMLTALKETLTENPRFETVRPYYHMSGYCYHLNAKSRVVKERDYTWVAESDAFNISHNVAPTRMTLGSNGCGDCHNENTHIFESWIAQQYPDGAGPHEISPQKLFLGKRPWTCYLNQLHKHNKLKPYVITLIVLFVFFLSFFNSDQAKMLKEIYGMPRDFIFLRIADRWVHFFRILSFSVLAFTGYIFLYNNMILLDIFFNSLESAIILHWGVGIFFMAISLVSVLLCRKKFPPVLSDASSFQSFLIFKNFQSNCRSVFIGTTIWLSLIMGITGVLLIFRDHFDAETNYILAIIHGFFAIIFVALIISHICTTLMSNPVSWRVWMNQKDK